MWSRMWGWNYEECNSILNELTPNKIHLLDLDKFLEINEKFKSHEMWTKSEIMSVLHSWYHTYPKCVSDREYKKIKKLFMENKK